MKSNEEDEAGKTQEGVWLFSSMEGGEDGSIGQETGEDVRVQGWVDKEEEAGETFNDTDGPHTVAAVASSWTVWPRGPAVDGESA